MNNNLKSLARKENWPILLDEFIKEYEYRDFKWGENDCCLMIIDWINRSTGSTVGEFFIGKYSTKQGAYRKMKTFCNGGIKETFDKIAIEWACESIMPLMAQRGDVIIVNELHEDGIYRDAGGICIGRFVLVLSPEKGTIKLPLSSIKYAWRI